MLKNLKVLLVVVVAVGVVAVGYLYHEYTSSENTLKTLHHIKKDNNVAIPNNNNLEQRQVVPNSGEQTVVPVNEQVSGQPVVGVQTPENVAVPVAQQHMTGNSVPVAPVNPSVSANNVQNSGVAQSHVVPNPNVPQQGQQPSVATTPSTPSIPANVNNKSNNEAVKITIVKDKPKKGANKNNKVTKKGSNKKNVKKNLAKQ